MFTFEFKDPHSTLTVRMTSEEESWRDLLPVLKQFLQATGFSLPRGELKIEEDGDE